MLDAIVRGLLADGVAAPQAVSDLAEAVANRDGATLVGRGIRLPEAWPPRPVAYEVDEALANPYTLGRMYEQMLSTDTRRRGGVHLTPSAVARRLVACTRTDWSSADATATVFDPAVGGGAFLVAVAERMVAAGVCAAAVVPRLGGYDIDPHAVAVAEAALAVWAIGEGIEPSRAEALEQGDGLLDPIPQADVVVGNPPFLNQLRSRSASGARRKEALRDRWGSLVGAYTDDAWLFLAAACDALAVNGWLAMVQPVSILAAKHAGPVREQVQRVADLDGLWISDGKVFDAIVEVCGVVAHRRATGLAATDDRTDGSAPLHRWVGSNFDPVPDSHREPSPASWGPIGAFGRGVPDVDLDSSLRLETIASATAGFRDQFYGFAPHVREGEWEAGTTTRPLVTVGMIDPLTLRWGGTDFRFAKKTVRCPVVDVEALALADHALATWADARRRPKLLVATQTRLVEVWVDVHGDTIPATPVISVEPANADDIWLVAAALSSPAVAAHFVAQKFGTALSLDALKLSASDVIGMPLPVSRKEWLIGADLARQLSESVDRSPSPVRDALLASFAESMVAAYDAPGDELVAWWLGRLPRRHSAETG